MTEECLSLVNKFRQLHNELLICSRLPFQVPFETFIPLRIEDSKLTPSMGGAVDTTQTIKSDEELQLQRDTFLDSVVESYIEQLRDGDCLFHAILQQLCPLGWEKMDKRQQVTIARHIVANALQEMVDTMPMDRQMEANPIIARFRLILHAHNEVELLQQRGLLHGQLLDEAEDLVRQGWALHTPVLPNQNTTAGQHNSNGLTYIPLHRTLFPGSNS